MIRIVVFLIVAGAAAFAVTLLADRPGDVVITWLGQRIEMSLMVLAGAIVLLMAVIGIVWSIARAILRSPMMLSNMVRNRRGVRAYEAISSGLIAVGAGDVLAAHKFSVEVNRIAAGEPLALLLTAQAAQLAGDRDGADRAFRAMASRADTKALGLHGLFVEAQRRNDPVSARAYAEEAARSTPTLSWAGRAVLEFRCAASDWAGALALLERNKQALDKTDYRRQRAVLLTAQAIAGQDSDRDNARLAVLEAVKLAPTLVPAAALAGRMLAEAGELRKASRIVAKAWRANPHPDLALTYSELRFGDAARDRLARVEALTKKTPGNPEAALAIARAALDAREFGKARAALAPYQSAPTRRVCLLMAELERSERNDEGRAREWMARALHAAPDPQWTADGYVSVRWLPISPVTGRLDAFEWRVPLTGMVAAPVIEPEAPRVGPDEALPKPVAPAPTDGNAVSASAPTAPEAPRRRSNRTPPKTEPVIPLVHAPDDPGPESSEEA
jgi:HemY protein